jgi:hypothetical protein
MRQEHAIQNVRFTARIPSLQTATWASEQHTLMYPRPDVPVGSDRLPQFTVNTILNMKFNHPIQDNISVVAVPVIGFSGEGGTTQDLATSRVNIASVSGKVTVGGFVYSSPPPPEFGSNPNLIKFLTPVLKGNLGQSISYRVVFYNPNIPKPGEPPLPPLFIDVTFFGVLLSSPYLINRDYNA